MSVAVAIAIALRSAMAEPPAAPAPDAPPAATDAPPSDAPATDPTTTEVKTADADTTDAARVADSEPTGDVPEAPAASTTAPPTPAPVKRTGPKAAPTEAAITRQSTVQPPSRIRRGLGRSRPGTKQRFAVEIKLGPYLPEIDSRYSGPGFGPYATIFGRTNGDGVAVKAPRLGVMPVAHFEWQIAYLGGPIGIGTQIGFFRDRAKALFAEPVPGEDIRSNADKVTFGMVPMALLAVYRFELLADFYRVPLVPYAKAGVAYSFWWMRDGTKKVAVNEQGEKARGGVVGWQLNPGVALRLDFIERNSAKKLDQTTGINHTYIFGEFQLTRLRNFGVGNSIDLGDKTFFGGLAIEF